MSSRKTFDVSAGGESQKQSVAGKVKQKRTSNASDTPPGPIIAVKKNVNNKKVAVSNKAQKTDLKNIKTPKAMKKIAEKEFEEREEKKESLKKTAKQKLKDKLITKTVKKPLKEAIKKGKALLTGSVEKLIDKSPPKLKKAVIAAKKTEDKEEKKSKEKTQKEKKLKELKETKEVKETKDIPVIKDTKKKQAAKASKKLADSDIDLNKPPKLEKKEKPKKVIRASAKSKGKLNDIKKIEDSAMDCMDVVKDEKGDDVPLLQVFQLKNNPVCDFDGGICNTITIRQDNTCIKIKEISVSQLPYSVKTEQESEMAMSKPAVKKESKAKAEKQPKPKPIKEKIVKNVKKEKAEKKTKASVVGKTKTKPKPKVSPKAKPKTGRVSKRPRVASLNAIAKVHCLYENETKSALIDSLPASALAAAAAAATTEFPVAVPTPSSKVKQESKGKSSATARKGKRTSKRTTPGLKSVGRHWDMHDTSSNSSSSGGDDVKYEPPKSAKRIKKQPVVSEPESTDDEGPETSTKQVVSPSCGSKRKRRNADTVTMDLKDMVVKKRMASLNASAILAASYSTEKKPPPSIKGLDNSPNKSTSSSDVSSVRSEPEDDAEDEDSDGHKESSSTHSTIAQQTPLPPIIPPPSSQLAVIVNQDTDVTITGVYVNSTTRSTRHEEFCTISGLQYRISSTSHTQTEATAVATETVLHADHAVVKPPLSSALPQQPAAPRPSYAPLTALSSMQPPGTPGGSELHPQQRRHHHHPHHGVPYGSAFSAPPPPPSAHQPNQTNGSSSDTSDKHEPGPPLPPPPPIPYAHGYYQPAGPLITHHIVPHHVHLHHPPHVKPSSLVPPLVPTPPSSTGTAAPPQTESSDNEIVPVRSTSASTPPGYHRYPPQNSYHPPPIPSYYPSPPASANLQYPPPPQVPQHHYLPEPNPCVYPGVAHHQPGYFHHSRSSPYHHIAYHHRRPAPPYNPAIVGPPTYYHEYYGHPPGPPPAPPGSPGQQQQMLVAARPGDRPDHHPQQQPDAYPAPQPLYYSPYGAPPGPSCYPPAPPRTYVDPAYHSCPCPMQTCPNPKNVHTGPLTGAVSKGPKHHSTTVVTLPPVALALPQEPPRALGPPSPARGSAGVARPARSGSSCSPSKQVPWCMSPLSPARASVQHLAPQSPAMLTAKNPTSEWNTTEDKCDTTGLLAIGKMLSESVLGLEQPMDDDQEIIPKIEPVDEDMPASYYTLKVNMASEDRQPMPEQLTTIDLSMKPNNDYRETTTVYCDPSVNHNNNNIVDGEDNNKLIKGSAKRKKPNPTQIVLAKKSKIQNETHDVNFEQVKLEVESTTDDQTPVLTTDINIERKNSEEVTSTTDISNVGELDSPEECEEVLRSAMSDDSDSEEMVGETFVKKKNVPKKTKKGRKDRKSGGNKKEMTDAMKREMEQRMREEFAQLSRLKKQDLAPRWSNGWMWEGKPFKRPVYLENDDVPVLRKCYPCMRHMQGDTIYARDCVLLKSGSRKNDLPFIAKIASLWEDPVNGEMMMSLLWYYRPEHTKQGRQKGDMPDELFASKHRDVNSVACIDDRCYVLTFNEYCRHRKHIKSVQENLVLSKAVVPPLQEFNPRGRQLPAEGAPTDLIFFCRRVYDCRQKRLLKKQSL
ncbi:proline-rich protein 36-like [Daktulosphaira vitifoliae]|uniref:proline-rich protein 36-like n=1 Tax=Daktulosphaira vitifoliae TaxID=58002 RepID=UPI0021AA4E52|nr:proline-rich protein 36-like [Daktulosphaira vitifoliae]